jgi:hypothetical protein
MDTTFTFRMSAKQRAKLRRRAKLFGKSEAELLRDILDRELDDRPMGERLKHLKGSLWLPKDNDPWRKLIREHNWRD